MAMDIFHHAARGPPRSLLAPHPGRRSSVPPSLKRGGGPGGLHWNIDVDAGSGSLQVVLDKGQEDDWFGSHFITTLAITATVSCPWWMLVTLPLRARTANYGQGAGLPINGPELRNPQTSLMNYVRTSRGIFLPKPFQVLFGFRDHLPCGMKPGLPVFTTSLNRCLV
jgi:hypothetical protein